MSKVLFENLNKNYMKIKQSFYMENRCQAKPILLIVWLNRIVVNTYILVLIILQK